MKTSFAGLAIGVVIALGLAACDGGPSSPDVDASASPGFTAGGGGGAEKVAVCHVGTQQPAYDPTCPTCGDAGKVDLLFLKASVAAKHLEQGHDGQLVDYDPFAAGATGVGQEDTSDDGKYVDDGCVIPEEPEGEVIHAVAYIDEDPNDGGYNPNVDKLIAKLIDGENAAADGLIGPGDLIVTDQYPVEFNLSTVGSFAVNQHTVAGISSFTSIQIIVTRADGLAFQWVKSAAQEQYGEGTFAGEVSVWQDIVANQQADELIRIGNSPSVPSTGVGPDKFQFSVADDRFVDVEIRTVPN